MGEIYEKMRALALQQKDLGYSKEVQRTAMMLFWDAILEQCYNMEEK